MSLSVDLTPAQESRVEAAFGSLEVAQDWLRAQLVSRVVSDRMAALQRDALTAQRVEADALRKEFG